MFDKPVRNFGSSNRPMRAKIQSILPIICIPISSGMISNPIKQLTMPAANQLYRVDFGFAINFTYLLGYLNQVMSEYFFFEPTILPNWIVINRLNRHVMLFGLNRLERHKPTQFSDSQLLRVESNQYY